LTHLKMKFFELITVHHEFYFLDLLLLSAFIELIKQVWVLQDPKVFELTQIRDGRDRAQPENF